MGARLCAAAGLVHGGGQAASASSLSRRVIALRRVRTVRSLTWRTAAASLTDEVFSNAVTTASSPSLIPAARARTSRSTYRHGSAPLDRSTASRGDLDPELVDHSVERLQDALYRNRAACS